MRKIITIGLLAFILGCTTTPPQPPVTSMPVVVEPTKEGLEAQLVDERHKLELAKFEEYVNQETTQMMEFFSVQVGQLMLFKPIAYSVSEDNTVGVAKCEVYVGSDFVGHTYVIASNDGTGWKFLSMVNKEIEKPKEETP